MPFLFIASGCIEAYVPPIVDSEVNYLVVDGSLDGSDGTAQITLSRAVGLSSKKPSPPELKAKVSVEGSDGSSFALKEIGDGFYQQSGLTIVNTNEYRLRIKTADNAEYVSDYAKIKITPPIDELKWTANPRNDGIDILLNTHDDTRNARYYVWTFEETYENEAAYRAILKVANGSVVPIPVEEDNYRCWKTITSKKIIISSTNQLVDDAVYNFPVTVIPLGSPKVIIKYSVLVKQRAISKQAYNYWLALQKTTETLGSLFDPQPGKVVGNIRNVSDPTVPAIGYFDVGSTQSKRIFINSTDLPANLRSYKSYGSCRSDTVDVADIPKFDNVGNTLIGVIQSGPSISGYSFTIASCTDCRINGVTTKPSFWQ